MTTRRIESLLVHHLRAQPDITGKLAVAADALRDMGGDFEPLTVEILAGELRSAGLARIREMVPPGASSAYLYALLASEDDAERAAAAWEHFFAQHYSYDPFHRLAYARALAAGEHFDDAARQLQLALSQPLRYAFFPRAEKLIRTVAAKTSGHLRQVRVAILGTSTTSLLVPVLEALCLRDRVRIETYQGLYGAVNQEILDPNSGLAAFRPDIVFLVNHWRDLSLPVITANAEEFIGQIVNRQKAL